MGGSLFSLVHFGHWENLVWPGTRFVIFLVGLVGFEMACRSLRLKKVCALMGQKISFWESTWVGALGDVYGAATPSSVGGEFSRIAALARFGIKGSKALMVLASERLALLSSLTFVMLLSAVLILIQNASVFSIHSLFYTLLFYMGLALGLIVLLIVMIRHKKMKMPLKKLLLRPDIFLLAMAHHVVRLGILPLILWIFARQAPNLQILIWSFILGYGISLLPIPSGGGSVELMFMTVFKPILGEEMAALILIWWRFSGHYFYVVVGLLVTLWGVIGLSKRDIEVPL